MTVSRSVAPFCWHGIENEETPFEQSVSIQALSQVWNPMKHYSPEKRNVERPSFVKSCIFCMSGNPLTCRKVEKEFPTTLSLQHQVIPNDDKLNKSTKCAGVFHDWNSLHGLPSPALIQGYPYRGIRKNRVELVLGC
ncbi:hypothetical protein MUG91_G261n8 [Manis pentadactyla]|nr:hypothetical protein MUG91_G261n8 [Manis pentadactyla]